MDFPEEKSFPYIERSTKNHSAIFNHAEYLQHTALIASKDFSIPLKFVAVTCQLIYFVQIFSSTYY